MGYNSSPVRQWTLQGHFPAVRLLHAGCASILFFVLLQVAGDHNARSIESLLSRGDYHEALLQLERRPPAEKATGQWHLLASKAYDGLDQPKQAVAEVEAALAADPHQERYYLQLGQIFVSRNTPRAALEIFDDALRLFPDSLLILLGRGVALMNLGRYEEAEKDFGTCLARKPDLGIAFESLETVYLETSRPEEAERAARQYQTRNPADSRSYYFLAAAQDRLHSADIQGNRRRSHRP